MPTESQKALNSTFKGIEGVICYPIVTKGEVSDHNLPVDKVMRRLDYEGWALKYSTCEFPINKIICLGQ